MAQKTRWRHSTLIGAAGAIVLASQANVSLKRLDQVLNSAVAFKDDDITFTGKITFGSALGTVLTPQAGVPGAPAEGTLVYTTAGHQIQFWNGTAWVGLSSGSTGVASVTGTANQITAAPTTGNVILSLPNNGTLPATWHAATGFTVDSGNLSLAAGKLLIDGTDQTLASGEIGVAENAGEIWMGARSAVRLLMDDDNTGAGSVIIGKGTQAASTTLWTFAIGGDLQPGTNNSYDIGTAAGNLPRTIRLATSVITPTVVSAAATALNFGDGGTNRWQIAVGGHFIALTDNANDIGTPVASPNRPRAVYVGTQVKIGSAEQTVSSGQLHLGQAGRIDQTWYDSTAAADGKIWALSVNGAGGANSFGIAARNDAGTLGNWLFRATRSGTTIPTFAVLENGGVLILGADPGGAQLFRVGGTSQLNGAVQVVTGDLTLTAGRLVFGAAASKVVPGATSLSLRNTADSADNLALTDAGLATFRNNVSITSVASAALDFFVDRPAGFTGGMNFRTAGVGRWGIYVTEVAEGGADSGSNFRLRARTDAGVFLDDPITIVRATGGAIAFNRPLTGQAITATQLTLTNAVSKIIPGATSLSLRNNADSADNLLIADNGSITTRNSIQLTAGILAMDLAASKIRPGATSLSLRNNADSADNLLLTDAGVATLRNEVRITGGANPSVAGGATLQIGGGGTTPNGVSFAWGDNTGWKLRFGTGVAGVFTPRLNITDTGLVEVVTGDLTLTAGRLTITTAASKIVPGATSLSLRNNADAANNILITDAGVVTLRNDLTISTLGTFDSTDAPLEGQTLIYKSGVAKWQAEHLNAVIGETDFKAAILTDGAATYILRDPGASGGALGALAAPATPFVAQAHGTITLEIQSYTKAAHFRYFEWALEKSTDSGGTWPTVMTVFSSSTKIVHSRLDLSSATVRYRYRARAIGKNAADNSAFSAYTATLTPTADGSTAAFGAIIAGEIAVANLSAIKADLGIIVAGIARNSGNTAGINFGGQGGIPGTWTAGINFEAAAGSGSMTRYINFTASGANPFLRHELLSLNADGSATFGGRLNVAVSPLNISADTVYHTVVSDVTPTSGTPNFTHFQLDITNVVAGTQFGTVTNLQLLTGTFTDAVTTAIQQQIQQWTVTTGSITTQYGLKIEDFTAGTTNYALYSGTGIVRHGDELRLDHGSNAHAEFYLGGARSAGISVAASSVLRLTDSAGTVRLQFNLAAAGKIIAPATSLSFRNNADSADNLLIADSGDLTGRTKLTMPGPLTLTTAASKIVPGATSLALRNTADSADNLIILDAGDATLRTKLTMPGPLVLTTAASKLIPGATSLALRNTADSADNLLIVDAGDATFRTKITLPGPITFTTAASKIVPGATSLSLRNNADSADNLIILDAGDATFRTFIELKEIAAPGTPSANVTRDYAKDVAGVSTRFWKDDAGVEHPHNLTLIDTQTFTATGAGTWTKPAGAVLVRAVCVGGGGGGGGGRGGAAASLRQGGTGGGGGAFSERWFNASDLGATESLSVGAGGAHGNGGSSADGTNGAAGSDTWFGNALVSLAKQWAYGGGAGGLGTTTLTRSGGGGGGAMSNGANGGTAATAGGAPNGGGGAAGQGFGGGGGNLGAAGAPAAYGGGGGGGEDATLGGSQFDGGCSQFGGGGGGAGGGVSTANTERGGGVGGDNDVGSSAGGGAAGAVNGGAGGAGAAGDAFRSGQGGGGGGGQDAGTGGAGGAGGAPGGGGGGGAGGTTVGGAGADGARGEVRVYTYA